MREVRDENPHPVSDQPRIRPAPVPSRGHPHIEDTARRAQLSLSALSSKRFGYLTSRLAVAWSCQMRSGMHAFTGTCRSHSIRTQGPMSPSQFISAFSPNYFACARHESYPHTALTDGTSKHLLTDAPRIKSPGHSEQCRLALGAIGRHDEFAT